MSGYIGVLPVPQTTQTRESFTATAGQTSFGTSGYQIDHLDVYLNGVKLAAADFTATNGSDIVLATGAAVNDILEMVAFETFTIANQSFTGTTTVDTLVVTNTVDGRNVSVDGAKLDTIPIISTSSTPSFTAKGDGTTDGYIQLNCSQNSHGIKLKSPPHSANASYTLTFPNDDGNAGQFLKTNGSGVLSWATDSTTDSTKLPLAGGAMTGPITTNSTFDGVDVATRDAVLTSTTTTAGAALPKAGGVLTGAVTTNSTFDGRDVATDGTKLDTVETNADVTDAANVTSAGALMDSELTNLAAVKAINQSLVTTASPTFAGMGIGTSSPNSYSGYGAMTIDGTTGSLLDFEVNGTVTGELYADSGITGLGIGLQAIGSRIIHFKTNNQERMRINSSGVAITGELVSTSVKATNFMNIQVDDAELYFTNTANDRFHVFARDASNNLSLKRFDGSSTSTDVVFDLIGNVGVGGAPVGSATNYNSAVIHARQAGSSSVGSQLRLTTGATGHTASDGSFIAAWADSGLYITNQESAPIAFSTSGAERGRFTAAGDFLIGTQSVIDAGSGTQDGFSFSAGDRADFSRNNACPLDLRIRSSDGAMLNLYKDTANVGNLRSRAGVVMTVTLDPRSGGAGISGGGPDIYPTDNVGGLADDRVSFGASNGYRFKNMFLSGGVYLGGVGSANKLSDYEEGTWTPSLTTASSTTVYSAYYTKIGKTVLIQAYIAWSNNQNNNSNQFRINGLPFVVGGNSNSYHSIPICYWGAANMNDAPAFITHGNQQYMYLHKNDGTDVAATNSSITNSSFTTCIFSGSYQTN